MSLGKHIYVKDWLMKTVWSAYAFQTVCHIKTDIETHCKGHKCSHHRMMWRWVCETDPDQVVPRTAGGNGSWVYGDSGTLTGKGAVSTNRRLFAPGNAVL